MRPAATRPFGPVGIIDIGSNSVRLVAYGGSERVPSMLFNEKVMAGLGRDLAVTGLLHPEAVDMAVEALARFRLLGKEMRLNKLHAVATAAVREAVAETGASGVKDMGKVMAALRARHAATLDMAKAGPMVKAALGGG